jgi:putative ubiquitin-RnfH superfamily antitoxin RatB of RatAB toxin-antitoxin module
MTEATRKDAPVPREAGCRERPTIVVDIVYALPERAWSVRHMLPAPATVGQALALGLPDAPGIEVDASRLAVFGRAVGLDSPLHDGDRIEILRPLQVDPKQARRERASEFKRRPRPPQGR